VTMDPDLERALVVLRTWFDVEVLSVEWSRGGRQPTADQPRLFGEEQGRRAHVDPLSRSGAAGR
jgi:hypothetical protein